METKQKEILGRIISAVIVPIVLLLGAVLLYSFGTRIYSVYPEDFHYEAAVLSYDNFYDEETEQYVGDVRSKTEFILKTLETSGTDLNVENSFEVTTFFDEEIFSVTRNYTVASVTGEHTDGFGNDSRSGYLFAPQNLKKNQDFLYWHINYDAPAKMSFVAQEEFFGTKVFKYESDYSGAIVDQTDQLGHLPGVPEERGVRLDPKVTIWVEPVTGWLVKYADSTEAYYYDKETGERTVPWNVFHNTMSDESVAEQIEIAEHKRGNVLIFGKYIPLILLIIATLLIVSRAIKTNIKKSINRLDILSEFKFNVVKWVAVFSICIGSIVLIGWSIDNEVFKRLHPGFIAMNPVTAVLFIVLGIPFVIKEKYFKRAATVSGLFLLTISLTKLTSELFSVIPDIDLLLFKQSILDPADPPSLMSRITAATFSFLAVSLLTFSNVRDNLGWIRRLVSSYSALFAGLLGATGVFGYITRSSEVLRTPLFFSLALHTAILFILVGGVLHATVGDSKLETTLRKNS